MQTQLIHWNVISLALLQLTSTDRHNQFSNLRLFVDKSLQIFKSVSPLVLAGANFEFYREASFLQSVSPIFHFKWARLTEKHTHPISSHLRIFSSWGVLVLAHLDNHCGARRLSSSRNLWSAATADLQDSWLSCNTSYLLNTLSLLWNMMRIVDVYL